MSSNIIKINSTFQLNLNLELVNVQSFQNVSIVRKKIIALVVVFRISLHFVTRKISKPMRGLLAFKGYNVYVYVYIYISLYVHTSKRLWSTSVKNTMFSPCSVIMRNEIPFGKRNTERDEMLFTFLAPSLFLARLYPPPRFCRLRFAKQIWIVSAENRRPFEIRLRSAVTICIKMSGIIKIIIYNISKLRLPFENQTLIRCLHKNNVQDIYTTRTLTRAHALVYIRLKRAERFKYRYPKTATPLSVIRTFLESYLYIRVRTRAFTVRERFISVDDKTTPSYRFCVCTVIIVTGPVGGRGMKEGMG